MMFEKAKWIWRKDEAQADEHVDFVDKFAASGEGKYTLTIASDSNYAIYINGALAAFGQYADYPKYKVADVVDVTEFVRDGENRVAVVVWYYGIKDTSTYYIGTAGLIYEIKDEGGNVLSCSDENTLSRLSPAYIQHKCDKISGQLGLTFHRNEQAADSFITEDVEGFENSRVVSGISYDFHRRPIKKLELRDRLPALVCQQGTFEYTCDRETGPNIQHAALSFHFIISMANCGFKPHLTNGGNSITFKAPDYAEGGIYFIVDTEKEHSGFIDFDIEVPEDCRIDIGWGEHLVDGRVRTAIPCFWCDFLAKKGRNTFFDPFRRMGCRYVQFFIHAREATVHYAGLRPTSYPLNVKEYKSGNLLRDTIYEVCQNTLIQCMHEHYEDCPNREQALYTLDSRNQMLCGYYAFGETEFPRASLRLIAEGLLDEGLLTLCYPSDADLLIPSYSCAYLIQMAEYIEHSGDSTLATECFDVLSTLMNTFDNRMKDSENGLVRNFTGNERYWNYYEWQPTLMGEAGYGNGDTVDAPLNAFFSLALDAMAYICEKTGLGDAEYYRDRRDILNTAIRENYFNKEVGLFETRLDQDNGRYSVLVNSLCLLCGAAEGLDTTNILRILATNGEDNLGLDVIPNTLSMNSFRFDALLKADFEKYKPVILDEIDRDYLKMLRGGATTFWETMLGETDLFGVCGSLCHGWSALPIYYYEILNK